MPRRFGNSMIQVGCVIDVAPRLGLGTVGGPRIPGACAPGFTMPPRFGGFKSRMPPRFGRSNFQGGRAIDVDTDTGLCHPSLFNFILDPECDRFQHRRLVMACDD
jgi:hypothetical protein